MMTVSEELECGREAEHLRDLMMGVGASLREFLAAIDGEFPDDRPYAVWSKTSPLEGYLERFGGEDFDYLVSVCSGEGTELDVSLVREVTLVLERNLKTVRSSLTSMAGGLVGVPLKDADLACEVQAVRRGEAGVVTEDVGGFQVELCRPKFDLTGRVRRALDGLSRVEKCLGQQDSAV